jgi:hypothetical protein
MGFQARQFHEVIHPSVIQGFGKLVPVGPKTRKTGGKTGRKRPNIYITENQEFLQGDCRTEMGELLRWDDLAVVFRE